MAKASSASETNNAILLKGIFEKKYDRDNWIKALRQVFNVTNILAVPRDTGVEKKEWDAKVYELGSFETLEGQLVGIYEVPINSKVKLERNKVGLREMLKSIYKNEVDAAFIVFDQDSKWRFSYVSEIRVKDKETGKRVKKVTDPKRYTYMLGEGERCKTASEMFAKIEQTEDLLGKGVPLKSIEDAFNVDKVSKAFFDGYRDLYGKFTAYLTGKNENNREVGEPHAFLKSCFNGNEKEARNFIKKTLGRIVFLYFLEKKGWLGVSEDGAWGDGDENFVSNLYRDCKHKETFYSQVLVPLFFNTLNKERKGDLFDIDEDVFSTGDYHKQKIPFLNGGLFEEEENKKTNTLVFEPKLFSELFTFFDQYNFTVYEDNPEEHTVAVDPEMLGHIFENLLEDNKDKGTFYTPKEIVHYMCQQSITEYLYTKLNAGADKEAVPKEAIQKFIKNKELAEIIEHDEAVLSALREVKICDPAIGSGAFPMGLLHEIFYAVELLSERNDAALRIWKMDEWNPAKVKLSIIENSIYGVDIEAGAVDIARLRFWLSLVVDEDTPQPLPNLDYKIVVGNSLLPVLKIDGQEEVVDIDWRVDEGKKGFTNELHIQQKLKLVALKEKQHLYFNIKLKKATLHREIESLKADILINQLNISKKSYSQNTQEKGGFDPTPKEKKHNLERELKIKGYDQLIVKLHNAKSKQENIRFFDWKLSFAEVMTAGVTKDDTGFDIVIGNPPYLQLQKMGEEADLLQNADYDTFARTGDIYCLFYEKGNELLRTNGVLTYITSNKWMNAGYGKKLRKYLVEKANPTLLIDFSGAVIFPSAVVFVNILQFIKQDFQHKTWTVKAEDDYRVGSTILSDYIEQKGVTIDEWNEENWTVVDKKDYAIKTTIEDKGVTLKNWDISFFRGITSGLNEAFHIDLETKQTLEREESNSKDVIKPLLRGKDIKRYVYSYADKYMLFIPWHFPLHNDSTITSASNTAEKSFKHNYTAIYNHIERFKTQLSKRNKSETGIRYEWYALQRYGSNYWTEFKKEKIIWIEISDKANYCLDEEGHFLTNSAYFITGENLKYLLAVLNSKTMDFYHFQNTAQIAGGRKRYTKQYVELLPIVQLNDKSKLHKYEVLVEYLMYLNGVTKLPVNSYTENEKLIPIFEDTLNMMVYELYFEEHMKELEIDVLQFVNTDIFKPLVKRDEDDADIIGQAYKWLQEKDNPIRNRTISANIKSPDIIRRINSATH